MRTIFVLAAGICLVVAPHSASAQSYEGRGYGGALNVGPNFEKGGQYEPPDYGSSKPAKKQATSKRTKPSRNASKGKATKEAAKPSTSEDTESAAAQGNSSGPVPANDAVSETSAQSDSASTTVAAPQDPVTCKRFDANSGQTITVPCD